MNNKYWKVKNSYAAKNCIDRQVKYKSNFVKRITVQSFQTQEQHNSLKNLQNFDHQNKESNFEQLKKEIRHLQNSQIMSMKYNYHTQPEQSEGIYQFKSTGKEFFPNKKVAHFQKFKLYLKKRGKSKRLSFLLDNHNKYLNNVDYQCLDSLKIKDINIEAKGQIKLKKKETPYIVKKFYRPMTSNNKSLQDCTRSAQVRGRKLRTSVTTRKDKQNILICCY